MNRRNNIAHGSKTDGVTDQEYERWENSTKNVMENIVRKIYFYANNEKYLRMENECWKIIDLHDKVAVAKYFHFGYNEVATNWQQKISEPK